MFGSPRAFTDLKNRLLFLLGALVVYRIGSHIPVPGVNAERLAEVFRSYQGGILAMFNMFSGGALERFTVFSLGIMPYISASIIVQLMTVVFPSLESLQKEGEVGRRRISQYTRRGTVLLGLFQSLGVVFAMQANGLVLHPGLGFVFTAVMTLVCGTVFLMWLGEQITERGIGNGISMLIFAGIVSGLLESLGKILEMVRTGQMMALSALFVIFLIVGVTCFVVFMERGQRRIPIHYAKHQSRERAFTAQQVSHLPLKINMSGVMSPIFASSLILFPVTILSWFSEDSSISWLRSIVVALSPGELAYLLVYTGAIVFFSFFYTALIFNPKDTADNLKRSGAFVPGIRPGEKTAQYLDRVVARLTLAGAVYITLICLLPQFLNIKWGVPFYFGGTSLLIVVVVTMDFMAQVQAAMLSQHYDGLLKKTNFRTNPLVR